MLVLGAHMSIANGFAAAAEKTAIQYHCNAMQFFTKSPQGGMVKPIDPADAEKFRKICKKNGIKFIAAHCSYLINLAKPFSGAPWMKRDLTNDFARLHLLGGTGVIVHIGKSLSIDRDAAIKNVIENSKKIIDETSLTNLEYILENTAGQGSEIGYRIEELAAIWKALKPFSLRAKSCLDTAHFWGAGYDISSEKAVAAALDLYDAAVGIKTLACIHFNDSKKHCGSRVDRHDNIGDGSIGGEGLAAIAKFAEAKSIPLIIETPQKDGKSHLDDIEKVRGFLG
jgi:deoxyribonuclease IV